MSVNLKNHRWSVSEADFAVRVMIPDLNGFFKNLPKLPDIPKGRTLVIEPGTRALVIDEGVIAGELRGGSYTLESFIQRLQFWKNRQVTVFLTREEDVPLQMTAESIPTLENVCFDIDYRWTIQIQNVSRFLDNLMGARNEVSIDELSSLLMPITNQAVRRTVGRIDFDTVKGPDFVNLLSDGMSSQLETRLTRYGLALTDLQSVEIQSDGDGLSERKGEQWLQLREVQMQRAASVVENEELKAKLEDINSKVPIRKQLRDAVSSDQFNKIQSKEEFAQSLLEIDKQRVLRKEERDELVEAYESRKEDRDQLREHLLATMDLHREQELEGLRVETDYAVRQKSLQKEIELSELANSEQAQQWRHELQKEREQAEHRRDQQHESVKAAWARAREARNQKRDDSWEGILHEQKMEGVRAELEVTKAERQSRVALIQVDLESRLAAEKLEVEKRQKDWELEHKEKRSSSQMERMQKLQDMNAQFAERQQRMRVEMENLKADSASNRELNRIQAMSNLSTEALVATAGANNAALLADLKKHESTQDAAKAQAAANPAAELNEERLRMYEKMNEAEKSKADAIADAYKMAMQSQQGNVQQMIGGLAQAATPAPQPPAGFPPPVAPAAAPPPMPGAETWHVSLNGQQLPGLQLAQVQQYIQSGQLTRESMVWKTGMPAWAPAGQFPELAHLFNAPGPPPMPGTPPADGAPPMPQ